MDLIPAMQRAGQCLLNWADPQSEALSAGGYEVAHNIGRWFDAVLRLEHTIGFTIPPEHEAKMLRLLQLLTDNPDRMLINRPDLPWMAAFNNVINPHNLRETMLVHHALVRYRNREPDAGRTFCESLNRCFTDAGHFDATQLGAAGSVPFTQDPSHTEPEHPPHNWFDATATTGRALEAVIDFHQATDDPLALHLAQRLAQHHLEHSTNEDGSVRSEIIHPENVGHNHSYHGTLRGLLRFGLLTGQQSYIDTVAATYRVGLPQSVITESGWTPHDLGVTRFPNDDGDPVGETASVGDNAQLALWLARDAGQTHLLDNVERIVRSRILPAQVTEDHLRDNPDVKFGPAHLGGWGAHLPAHAAMGFALDVVAALAH
ncbi:MAG: hypothetical protein CMJ49_13030, partial [Planctomycetaceae bacterium]|nr:hypothetical protein [Planctomycetaceae bacterium]